MPHSIQSYQQALEFLFGRINYERVQPGSYSARVFKLDRMRQFLALLSDPHKQIPVVHIAGTKGKGSTAVMTAQMLTAAGYRVGLFTSPHVTAFEERMMVDGLPPTRSELVELAGALFDPIARLDEAPGLMGPTYFEIATAMAWLYFVQQRAEIAVLEVGIGGRLDATNLCRPEACVITNISRDHMDLLGNTLALIAREKAGIIKRGVPVVSGVTQDEPRQVIEEICRERNAPLLQLGHDIRHRYHPATASPLSNSLAISEPLSLWERGRGEGGSQVVVDAGIERPPSPGERRRGEDGLAAKSPSPQPSPNGRGSQTPLSPWERGRSEGVFSTVDVETPWRSRTGIPVPLPGEHQGENAALAVAAIDLLRDRGWNISDEAIAAGMANVRWPVRVEVMGQRPTVIVDAAHNDASVAALVKTLNSTFPARRRILIFAASREKDAAELLRQLLPEFETVIFTQYLNNPRAIPAEELCRLAHTLSAQPVHAAAGPHAAWTLAKEWAAPEDLICVTGSFFLAAEMRELIVAEKHVPPATDSPQPIVAASH